MNDDDKLTDIQEQYNLLSNLEEHFRGGLGLTPCIGVEIEFYIHGNIDIRLLEPAIPNMAYASQSNSLYRSIKATMNQKTPFKCIFISNRLTILQNFLITHVIFTNLI